MRQQGRQAHRRLPWFRRRRFHQLGRGRGVRVEEELLVELLDLALRAGDEQVIRKVPSYPVLTAGADSARLVDDG